MKLWQALEIIQKEGPTDPEFGICFNADEFYYMGAYAEIADAAPNWDGYSGNPTYPVEGSYLAYANANNLWNNPRRQEFLNWLIDYFKQLDK